MEPWLECSITDELLEKYENLLRRGLWGLAKLQYVSSGVEGYVTVISFTPFQIAKLDIKAFMDCRKEFTTEEWG
jgi:ATP-dependent Lon protease